MHDIHYTLTSRQPGTHIFNVTLRIANPDPAGQLLWLPNWIPGSYMIRDFSRNIVKLSAQEGERKLAVTPCNKSSWRVEPCSGPLTIMYEVYAWDLSVRSAHLDETHAYFNGSSVFLAVAGQEHLPHGVQLLRPASPLAGDWLVATSMGENGAERFGFGEYAAATYEELIDHPVEMGNFSHVIFDACDVPHDIIISGRHRADLQRMAADLQRICTAQIEFFGRPAPFTRYVFLIQAIGNGYGGLEHRASTSLLVSRDDLPSLSEPVAPGESYRRFLGLASHEYFHSWNVKRIKPLVFSSYALQQEVHTPLLWAFEGITSYYDDLFLLRSGLINTDVYLEMLGVQISRHLRMPGRFKQSLSDSSFDAWTKYYKQDENSPNAITSYYVKGSLAALCLDLRIRQITQQRHSLDDVMRQLWQEFGLTGAGVENEDIRLLCERLTGVSLQAFFHLLLNSTEELPLAELLKEQGVAYSLRGAEAQADAGGKAAAPDAKLRPVMGVRWQAAEGGIQLTHVLDAGAAQQAGLSAQDVIVAVDGLRVSSANFERAIGGYEVGAEVEVHFFRRDELMRRQVRLCAPMLDTCYLALIDDVAAIERAMNWMLGKTDLVGLTGESNGS